MSIAANKTDICPHCNIPNRFENAEIHIQGRGRMKLFSDINFYFEKDGEEFYKDLTTCRCTNCGNIVLLLSGRLIYPLGAQRSNAPKDVPPEIAEDYNEATLVEPLSKKAAAALARRCLQNMLHAQGIKKANLSLEIDEAITKLPSHLGQAIDAIRQIGNFAAHPLKYQQTGEIVEVEEGETEWILDVLEQLFDFYYVQPALTQLKKEALNEKLQALGKQPMK